MIALRYFCGFSLQIFPYAFFCLYPFRDCFRLSTKKTMLMALSIFIVMVIPFSLIAQFNIGGDYKELIWNVIFYIALLLFGVLFCSGCRRTKFYQSSRKTVCIFCCNELRILCYKHCYLFAPYFPVPIRLFYVSALCTGSHTYHKSGSCETISHADGANPYYDQCRSGITDLEDSLLPPCFVYSDCQHCTVLKHNKSFQ